MQSESDVSISDASEIAGVSRDTIKRRLAAGDFPGARRSIGPGPGGPWRIPIDDIKAAGLLFDREPSYEVVGDDLDLRTQLAVAQAELRALRAHNADLRRLTVCSCERRIGDV
ncbi:helix-turn-helix transcriptional regulator [Nocardioides tweenelious]|uniref:helix-turn-helix transcriptional regulator n=1 Tax=Nocardioides tweenelious TaxID=3156607 RepID=UPI003CCE1914